MQRKRAAEQPSEWSGTERRLLRSLNSPGKIQDFLDNTPYSTEYIYRSPRSVIRDKKAHCFDGALLAACALRLQGKPPLLLDLRAVRDDDHVLALYARNGRWGAIAKSNFVGLRFREPVYRDVRELAMSYFNDFYNSSGERTLREYSVPLDLRSMDKIDWMRSDRDLDKIATRLDAIKHYRIVSAKEAAALLRVDSRSFKAGMLGVNKKGLYSGGKE